MKPAPFNYFAPRQPEEALDMLSHFGEDAKILAGGQSLMPLLNLRLARPKVLVDINRLEQFDSISIQPSENLVIGALTRQRTVERSVVIRDQNPLLFAAIPLIGHFQNRNRGTFGGSVAHADPAAELPAVCLALEAEFVLRNAGGERLLAAKDFFTGYMSTAIQANELLTEIRVPSLGPRSGWGIAEITRRRGDFAIVGAVTLVQLDEDNRCRNVAIVTFGVAERPERMERAEQLLRGKEADTRFLADIANVISNDLDPISDVHASAEYRKDVGGVLARRVLTDAFARAEKGPHELPASH